MSEARDSDRQVSQVLWLLSTVLFFGVLNGTMINVALPFIGAHFEAPGHHYAWLVTGFSLTFGVFSILQGRWADLYGARKMYLLGLALTGVLAMGVAFAQSLAVAIALRVAQGAASAAIPAIGPLIVSRMVPVERRGAAMGLLLASIGSAAALGPFLGGLLVQLWGWRAVFLVPACLLLLVPLGWRLLPAVLDQRQAGSFDVMGAALLTVVATAALMAMGGGPAAPAWLTIALFSGGLLALHLRRAAQPFLRPEHFRNLSFVAVCVAGAAANACRFGALIVVPVLLVRVEEVLPVWVGVVLLPGALAVTLFSRRAGRWSDRVGARRPALYGSLVLAAGTFLMAAVAGWRLEWMALAMGVAGLGMAIQQSPLLSTASALLPPAESGLGIGAYMMLSFLGGAFGVALGLGLAESLRGDAWGPYRGALVALGLIGVVGALASLWLPDKRASARAAT